MNLLTTIRESPGMMALVMLAALTVLEYIVSAAEMPGAFVALLIIAIGKGAIILRTFMQIGNVFGGDH